VFPGSTDYQSHSVGLQVMDDTWMPTASATLTLVNEADGDKLHSVGQLLIALGPHSGPPPPGWTLG
jgi:hypothetical protein